MKYVFNQISYKFLKQVILLGVILFALQMKAQHDLHSEANAVSNDREANSTLGWSGSVDLEIDTVNVGYGNYAFKASTSSTLGRALEYTFAAEPGEAYEIKISAKQSGQGNQPAFANWEGFTGFGIRNISGTSWKEYRFVLNANQTDPIIRIYTSPANVANVGDIVYIDKVSIKHISVNPLNNLYDYLSNAASSANESNSVNGWSGGALVSSSNTETHGGDYAIRSETSSSLARDINYSFSAEPGETYFINIWGKRGEQNAAAAFANWSGFSNFQILEFESGTAWNKYSFLVTASSSAPIIRIYTGPSNTATAGDFIYIDDISIYKWEQSLFPPISDLAIDFNSTNSLHLNWSAPGSDSIIEDYEVLLNQTVIGTTNNKLEYYLTDLTPETNYDIQVRAIDNGGTVISASNTLNVSTLALTDQDKDGVSNFLDEDDDNDGIVDFDEGLRYFTKNGASIDPLTVSYSTSQQGIINTLQYNHAQNSLSINGRPTLNQPTALMGYENALHYLEGVSEAEGIASYNLTIDDTFTDFSGDQVGFLSTNALGNSNNLISDPDGGSYQANVDIPDYIGYADMASLSFYISFNVEDKDSYDGFFLEHREYLSGSNLKMILGGQEFDLASNNSLTTHTSWETNPDMPKILSIPSIYINEGINVIIFIITASDANTLRTLGFAGYGRVGGYLDTDNDGIANNLDLDSDDDGCFDVVEAGYTESAIISGELAGTGYGTMGEVAGAENGYDGKPGDIYLLNYIDGCQSGTEGIYIDTRKMPNGIFDIEYNEELITDVVSGLSGEPYFVQLDHKWIAHEIDIKVPKESGVYEASNFKIHTDTMGINQVLVFKSGQWKELSDIFYQIHDDTISFMPYRTFEESLPFKMNLKDGVVYDNASSLTFLISKGIDLSGAVLKIGEMNATEEIIINPSLSHHGFEWDGTQASPGLYSFVLTIQNKQFSGQFLIK